MNVGDILRYTGGSEGPQWYEIVQLPNGRYPGGRAKWIASSEGIVTDPEESMNAATGFSLEHPDSICTTRVTLAHEEGWVDISFYLLTGTLRDG